MCLWQLELGPPGEDELLASHAVTGGQWHVVRIRPGQRTTLLRHALRQGSYVVSHVSVTALHTSSMLTAEGAIFAVMFSSEIGTLVYANKILIGVCFDYQQIKKFTEVLCLLLMCHLHIHVFT